MNIVEGQSQYLRDTAKDFEDSEYHPLSFEVPLKVVRPGGTSYVRSVCVIIVFSLKKKTGLRRKGKGASCGLCILFVLAVG